MITRYNIKLRFVFFVGIIFCILTPLIVNAQQTVSDVRVIVHDIRQEKDSIHILFDLEAINIAVNPKMQLYFYSIIRGKTKEKKLFPIIIRNTTLQAVVNRAEKFSGDVEPVYTCFNPKGKNFSETIVYDVTIPAEEWMKEAHVVLQREQKNCRGEFRILSTETIADGIRFMEKPERSTAYILPVKIPVPPREEIKNRAETGEAQIIYRVGNAEINPELGNNQNELDKIGRSIRTVQEAQGVRINAITVSAYASPEGTWQSNLHLSERRAASLTGWLRRNYDLSGITLSSQGYGEDWKSLEKLLQEDPVMLATEKEYVLQVLDREPLPEKRKSVLRQYNGGRTYQYMLTHLFPKLRRSAYRIDFTVPEYSMETIKEVYQTRPDLLSMYEFYLLANQYEPESPQFMEVIEKSVAIYPNEKINRISKAVFCYQADDTESALRLLDGLENDPEAWLYFSAFHARNNELEKAEEYARKASGTGNPDAASFLQQIDQYKTDEKLYQEQLIEWEKYKVDP